MITSSVSHSKWLILVSGFPVVAPFILHYLRAAVQATAYFDNRPRPLQLIFLHRPDVGYAPTKSMLKSLCMFPGPAVVHLRGRFCVSALSSATIDDRRVARQPCFQKRSPALRSRRVLSRLDVRVSVAINSHPVFVLALKIDPTKAKAQNADADRMKTKRRQIKADKIHLEAVRNDEYDRTWPQKPSKSFCLQRCAGYREATTYTIPQPCACCARARYGVKLLIIRVGGVFGDSRTL